MNSLIQVSAMYSLINCSNSLMDSVALDKIVIKIPSYFLI
ncbi:MAG: hypothetical protein OFPII_04280 [Osedax symbiont Rs1]|nr:MAG: hypothetical protein OFPII_04280 [Osedax symbiont Rs1]